jgi:hypothetical protein
MLRPTKEDPEKARTRESDGLGDNMTDYNTVAGDPDLHSRVRSRNDNGVVTVAGLTQ